MGRRRTRNRHLPLRMYLKKGRYYFVEAGSERWIMLGRDYARAMSKYAEMTDPGRPCHTMHDVIERYRLHVTPHKGDSTRKNEQPQLTRLDAVFGEMIPDEITQQHVYRYMDGRSKYPTSANHDVTLLHHVFVKAIRWGAATKNPASGIEKPRSKPRDRYITDKEFKAVRSLANIRVQIAMDLAYLTGLRRGDILRLTRDNLTEDGLLVKSKKTGKALLFEITPDLDEVLERAKKLKPQVPGYYLIRTMQGQPYTGSGFSAIWQRLMKKAVANGVERFSFHDIRAKSASDSMSLQEASDRLGHTSKEITHRVYMRTPTKVKPLK